jgi:hypothetical protein
VLRALEESASGRLSGAVPRGILRRVRVYQMSYYDAHALASARLNQIPVLFSEDFNERVVEGMYFVNPYLSGFDADRRR